MTSGQDVAILLRSHLQRAVDKLMMSSCAQLCLVRYGQPLYVPADIALAILRHQQLEPEQSCIAGCLGSAPASSAFILQAHCVVLQLPQQLCVSRAAGRVGHEGGVKPDQAQAVVGRMMAQMRAPSASEGLASIMVRPCVLPVPSEDKHLP